MLKSIEVKGTTISYIEQNPSAAKTIFFVHGNSGSSNTWQKQFASPLLSGYRLIAFDLPAHGRSAALHDDNNYNLPFIAAIMAEAINACLTSQEYILVAFSLGTNIVAEMMVYDIYPKGVVLIAPCIVGAKKPFCSIGVEGFDSTVLFADEAPEPALNEYIKAATTTTDEAGLAGMWSDYKNVKAPFRSMLLKTTLEGKLSDQVDLLYENACAPYLVIYGQDEKIINPYYLVGTALPIYGQQIYKIPGASHFVHIDQPDATTQLIAGYCSHYF